MPTSNASVDMLEVRAATIRWFQPKKIVLLCSVFACYRAQPGAYCRVDELEISRLAPSVQETLFTHASLWKRSYGRSLGILKSCDLSGLCRLHQYHAVFICSTTHEEDRKGEKGRKLICLLSLERRVHRLGISVNQVPTAALTNKEPTDRINVHTQHTASTEIAKR